MLNERDSPAFSLQSEVSKLDDEYLDFDPAQIITGPPVYIRKNFSYSAHCTTTYSVEQAANIIDHIGRKTECETTLPFAVRLVEGNELVSIAEDNGEFACGEVLNRCLDRVQGFNVLVCVSQHVGGMFVTDMVQSQKLRAVKDAAIKALDILKEQLVNTIQHQNSSNQRTNQLEDSIAGSPENKKKKKKKKHKRDSPEQMVAQQQLSGVWYNLPSKKEDMTGEDDAEDDDLEDHGNEAEEGEEEEDEDEEVAATAMAQASTK
mmetsp:Transcript_28493/g.47868  ORF Transcript_28493/g.47868 Transcript_28493/m.47868 type:complete len:262 (-) Transcript_28493:145-930(-)